MKTQVSEKQAEARKSKLFRVKILKVSSVPGVPEEVISSVYFRTKHAAWEYFASMYGEYCMKHPHSSNFVRTITHAEHLQAHAHIKIGGDFYVLIFLEKRARD